jgi:hypothetical protein
LLNFWHCSRLRGETEAFSGDGEEALERGTGDTSAPERPIDPIDHLGLVVDHEGADRPGGLDDALHGARVITHVRTHRCAFSKKAGFRRIGVNRDFARGRGEEIEETILRLD